MNTQRLKQIEKVFLAALEISPGERESFYQGNCRADEELQREVESLLAFEKKLQELFRLSARSPRRRNVYRRRK